jgi:uncharacterized protein with ACT and thioredoxin-like domain
MRGAVEAAKEAGVEAVAFGDIHLADVRAYREERMVGTGIDTIFPLVGCSRLAPAAMLAELLPGGVWRSGIGCRRV